MSLRAQLLRINLQVLFIILSFFLLLVTGCGGGGSGGGVATPRVTGVASAGAPIVGEVWLKDSGGTEIGPQQLGLDGSFSFNVSGLTAPFILCAEGRIGDTSFELYSVSLGKGIANVNPLSNLAVAQANPSTANPGQVYGNPVAFPITEQSLDDAIADIETMMQALVNEYNASGNFLAGTYNANHTGWDGLIDVNEIIVETNGIVTVTDRVAEEVIGISLIGTDLTGGVDQIEPLEAQKSSGVPQDLVEIEQLLLDIFTVFFTRGDNLVANDIDQFFSNPFGVFDGRDRDGAIADWLGLSSAGGGKSGGSLGNVFVAMAYGAQYYHIDFTVYFDDGSKGGPERGLAVIKDGGQWYITGNDFYSRFDLFSAGCQRVVETNDSTSDKCGLAVRLHNPGSYDLDYAYLTGPGLSGLNGGLGLRFDAGIDDYLYHSQGLLYGLTNTTIGNIVDNAIYTLKVYDSGSSLVETRARILPKRPRKTTELANGFLMPASGLGVDTHEFDEADFGSTVTVNYTQPSAYQPNWLQIEAAFWDSGVNEESSFALPGLESNSTGIDLIDPVWLPDSGSVTFQAIDMYKRSMEYVWMYDVVVP